jgi:hypothetical protein
MEHWSGYLTSDELFDLIIVNPFYLANRTTYYQPRCLIQASTLL